MVYKHKKTGQTMLVKKQYSGLVSTLYILDNNNNKIREVNQINKHPAIDIHGNPAYKTAVCLNENLIEL